MPTRDTTRMTERTRRGGGLLLVVAALGWSLGMPSAIAVAPTAESPAAHTTARFSWQKQEASIALLQGDQIVWRFNHGSDLDVPYFHPMAVHAGQPLTWNAPPDHVWHHGLWFSWKYINGVNYWEINRATGKPDGRTSWNEVRIEPHDDHSARLSMTLDYRPANGHDVVLDEKRLVTISAPEPNGMYRIDWSSTFVARGQRVVLDRTPPKHQAWGGYAGLSVRFAHDLTDRRAVTPDGPVAFRTDHRYRGRASAVDYHGLLDGHPVGVAFLDHPDNPRHPTPWYLIDSPTMGYMNAALVHDEPMLLEPGTSMKLVYRLIVHPDRWDATQLDAACQDYQSR